MAYAVPNVAGVPPLLGGFAPTNALTSLGDDLIGLADDVLSLFPFSTSQQWGIFLDGVPVIIAESVLSIEFKQEWVIADYPIEEGGFESYDKVQRPFDVRMKFSAGRNEAARQALLESVQSIAGDYNLYDFVSPTDIIESVNIQHFDYQRTATSGLGLFVIEVWGWQIQVSVGSGLSNTASPASADPGSVGPAQPGTPTLNQIQMTNNGFAVGPV